MIAYLESHLGPCPVWNSEADQEKEFNKWKRWSSESKFISKVKTKIKSEQGGE